MWVVAVVVVVILVAWWRWRRSGEPAFVFVGSGLLQGYASLWHRMSTNGPAPLPRRGPAIIIANHTCSADAAFLSAACRRPLSFLVAREYYKIKVLRPLFRVLACVPVARSGGDAGAVRVALKRLEQGCVLCVFPEGGLSNAGRQRPRRGKAGAALLALTSRAPVFPVLIVGGPQTPKIQRSWLRPSGRKTQVIFGAAIDVSAYLGRPRDRKLLEEVTALFMERIASLHHPVARAAHPRNDLATEA
jgi:1-acyl-sn-glycerol-3-phosphate acyltransferase